jgi:hypothetical protein
MRAALLGSLGRGTKWNLPRHMVIGQPAVLIGAAATFAAVPAGSHLDLHVNGITPTTLVITFDGTENTRALYLARINTLRSVGVLLPAPAGPFFQKGGFVAEAVPASPEMQLRAFYLGTMGFVEVLNTTTPAVLLALGFAAGQTSIASSGVGLGTQRMRISAVQFFGGVSTLEAPAVQHATVTRVHGRGNLVMVDRQSPVAGVGTVASGDSTRFAPLHQAT